VHVMNAQLTMGENLADLGGMSLAVQALQQELKGADETQRWQQEIFFRSWANIWKIKQSDAYTVQQLATDPHAPASFRANLVKNVDAFYETFSVSDGAMFLPKETRVHMW
jgi:putative endopeptidase